MKPDRYQLFIIIFLFSITVYAQKNKNIVVIKNKFEAANIIANNSKIVGYEYLFPENVCDFQVNSSALMSVSVPANVPSSPRKRMYFYDLQKDTLLWEIKNTGRDRLITLDNAIIFGIRYMDLQTGSIKYYLPNDVFFVDTALHLGLGYKLNSNILIATSLETGKSIWHKKPEYVYYEKYSYYTDTSLFLASTSGLHLLNLKTGNGWSLKKKTSRNSKEEIAKAVGYAILAAGLAVVFGGVAVMPDRETLFRDIKSNALIENDLCYFASNDGIDEIEIATGKVIWSTPFEKNSSSKSQLFEYKDNVYMLNLGYAYLNNAPTYCGIAFVAGYDKMTGRRTFIHYFNKKEIILNYCTKDDYICINVNNKLYKFSFDDNSLLEEQLPFTSSETRETSVNFIAENQYFIDDGGTFTDLSKQNAANIYFMYDKKIYEIDEYFEIRQVEGIAKTYTLNYETADYKFICDGNTTIMLDNAGMPIAEIYTNSSITIKHDVIYYTNVNSVYAIKLSNLLAD